jgi:hypothetical protein
VARPRAADDFTAIRTRMEELRRERTAAPADDANRGANGAPPDAVVGSVRGLAGRSSGLSPIMRRALDKVRKQRRKVFRGFQISPSRRRLG